MDLLILVNQNTFFMLALTSYNLPLEMCMNNNSKDDEIGYYEDDMRMPNDPFTFKNAAWNTTFNYGREEWYLGITVMNLR